VLPRRPVLDAEIEKGTGRLARVFSNQDQHYYGYARVLGGIGQVVRVLGVLVAGIGIVGWKRPQRLAQLLVWMRLLDEPASSMLGERSPSGAG
jgi:hypothetical protein